MSIAGMILGCLLLGQAPDAVPSSPRAPAIRAGNIASQPSPPSNQRASNRARPSDLVADAILLPAGSAVSGQPMALLSALTSTPDRRQQLEATLAYWQLVQAVAEYHFCLDHAQDLDRLGPSGNEPTLLRLARASAAATLRQSELEATRAQCELARLLRLPAGAPLPLPSDRPHVGAYRTSYQQLFAGKTPPEAAMLMERILPIRRQVIDDQASAVQAAEDVLIAARGTGVASGTPRSAIFQGGTGVASGTPQSAIFQGGTGVASGTPQSSIFQGGTGVASGTPRSSTPRQGGTGFASADDAVLIATCSQKLLRQRRALMRAACEYNRNIAEYGLTVAPASTSPQALVAMLIGPVQRGTGGASGTPQRSFGEASGTPQRATRPPSATGVQPMSGTEPIGNPIRPATSGEPTLAPPRDEWRTSESAPTPEKLQPVGKNEPTLAPLRKEAGREAAPAEMKPMTPVEGLPPSPPRPRIANKPVFRGGEGREARGGAMAVAASPLYPALVDAKPAIRTKQLTIALSWDHSLPQGVGKPMSLADCLLRDAGPDRRGTIAAYWRLRQRAAEYQVLVQQSELLEAISLVALDRRNEPGGAAEMLRLRSAQLAARAAASEAHVALVEAQYALAVRIGATSDAQWPLASTVPHSGSYLLKLDAQPQAIVESWPIRRLAATIPALRESVQQHAAAVIEADAARVAAAEKHRAGGAPIDQAIEGVAVQTQQTMAILSVLTDYNQAIAEYVLTVLPPATPANRLVAALVVKP